MPSPDPSRSGGRGARRPHVVAIDYGSKHNIFRNLVAAGARVTVHNASGQAVTITADDGSFDVDVAAGTLLTFPAPEQPGRYAFTSRHSAAYTDVLVVE